MSKKINTTAIGLFIVIGVALGIAGLLLFSSSKLFTKTHERILYFNDSLNGLHEGAPVKYRGVTIGSVKRVMVRFNQADTDNAMPVLIELDEKLLRERMGDDSLEVFSERSQERWVRDGLRATLQSESLVTGVLYIGLDPVANAAPPAFHQLTKRYVEIPTESTQIQQLLSNLATFDIKGLEKSLNALVAKLDAAAGGMQMAEISAGITNLLAVLNQRIASPEITNDLASVRATVAEYRRFGEKLNANIAPLSASVTNTFLQADRTLGQYREVGEKLNARIDPLSDSVAHTLAQADLAMAQLRSAAQDLRDLVAPDAPLPTNIDHALRQLSGATQSLSVLLDFLKQHPNALITGRETSHDKMENKP